MFSKSVEFMEYFEVNEDIVLDIFGSRLDDDFLFIINKINTPLQRVSWIWH